MKFNFTKKELDNLPLPEGTKRLVVHDAKIMGLTLRVTSKGTKTFTVYKRINRGKPLRIALGRYPSMSIEQARKQAMDVIAKLSDGIDVNAERRIDETKRLTLRDVYNEYLNSKQFKPNTLKSYNYIMDVRLADWNNKCLSDITADMVTAKHKEIGLRSKAKANETFRVLRALYNFANAIYEDAEGRPLFPRNPVSRLSQTNAWYKIQRRRTVIKTSDLSKWFKSVNELSEDTKKSRSGTARDYMLFILFSGLRRNEAATLTWNEVDFENKTFTVPDTKNHTVHTLPLSSFLLELLCRRYKQRKLNCMYVFPNRNEIDPIHDIRKQMLRVIRNSGVVFTIHDLRRTFITIAESLDISFYTLKRLLNHNVSNDVTAGYIITDVERLREPMEKISRRILSIIDESERLHA